jgi:large exoprotein involved in heme utilization and adhesion
VLFSVLMPGAAAQGSPGGVRALAGPNYLIDPNLHKQVGGSLFGSFGSFGVGAGQSATFIGPASVDNIIGEVTGGNPSTINGTVRSDNPRRQSLSHQPRWRRTRAGG